MISLVAGGLVLLVVAAFIYLRRSSTPHINKTVHKHKPKVVNTIDIEDLSDATAFCRCWKSSKFPYCDGSHNTHNKECGDNVGPLLLKRKTEN